MKKGSVVYVISNLFTLKLLRTITLLNGINETNTQITILHE